ncbi:metal ABC transporter ATP-binding protein [Candidatus Poriferisocius sp.]|uniref:metal ABC transporter ATP-binding protein n=1 Tax=Candidatus Poriferisocius sp. TaxID=3101276 RepID=UPI003B59FDFE
MTGPVPPAVQLRGVDARHGRTLALQDVSLSIEAGSVTAVIGPNGSGKSTLFGLISGRLRPSAGTVATRGAVADVLQATAVDSQLRLTVDDVVRMGRYPSRGLLRPMRRADLDACEEALGRVDLLDHRRRPINQLSGGQRQRAFVAQGIAQQAPVLLLDEPATGLDARSHQLILQVIREEADAGRAVLFSTHHLADAHCADTVIALACRCVCCAPPATAMDDPAVTSLFAPQPLRPPQSEPVAMAR